jgi:tRNA 2-thiouridine synthesizing protein A
VKEIIERSDDIQPTSSLDVEGLSCPLPLLLTKKKLVRLALGDILQVNGLHNNFILNFKGWCERSGHVFLGKKEIHGKIFCFVEKGKL